MARRGCWTNIGKKGSFSIVWDVICEYRKNDRIMARRIAHTNNKEEAEFICNLLKEATKDVENIIDFVAFEDEIYHNTQVNDDYLKKLLNETDESCKKTTEILQAIWQYEEDRKQKYEEV